MHSICSMLKDAASRRQESSAVRVIAPASKKVSVVRESNIYEVLDAGNDEERKSDEKVETIEKQEEKEEREDKQEGRKKEKRGES